MPENRQQPSLTRKLFQSMNMNDLPAMSAHVQELIQLCGSSRATATELTEAILKDYSLTNKMLQVANSAYYYRGIAVTSIFRAVTVIGFDLVKQLAMAIALFEELIQNTSLKDRLIGILTKSFLSAMQARLHCTETNLHINPEEAFLCALLYNLGEVVVLVYLPEHYMEVVKKVKSGQNMDVAAAETLQGLTFLQIGREIVRFWNFSRIISRAMVPVPPVPKNAYDKNANLTNLVIFSNRLTSNVCSGREPGPVLLDFCVPLQTDMKHSMSLFEKSLEASLQSSHVVRKGEIRMKIHHHLKKLKLQYKW